MRKALLTLMFLSLTTLSYSQWTFVGRPSGANVNSISVVNGFVVWIACDSAKIFKSTDGGQTWQLRNAGIPNVNLLGISAVDTSNCWVGTFTGSIYRTSNGGSSWTLQHTFNGGFTDGIKMFNLNYGIYYGDPLGSGQPFQFRYTTNGGTNWLLSPNVPVSQNDYGVQNAWDWLDTSRIWIGAANATTGATSSRIFRTTTGFGSGSWSSVTLPGSGTSDGLYWQAIAFNNANNGIAGSNGGNLRRTTDGGATWQLLTNPPGLGVVAMVTLHGFKDGSNITRLTTIGGAVSKMFVTTNLGSSWTEETLPTQGVQNKVNHLDFVNQNVGYAGCAGGYVLRYGNPSAVNHLNTGVPEVFRLEQNYPNPFNPSTTINFSVPKAGVVSMKLYDLNGREVAVLINEFKEAGNYSYAYSMPSGLNSGVYFYTFNSGDFSETKKLMLVK